MINKNSSIDQLLRDLVLEYGKELYTDKQRLYNFIADLYTGEEKFKRVYRRVIMEDSISLRIHEISLKPFSERAAFCNQLSKQIAENNFWSEEFGQQITQSFIEGLSLLEIPSTEFSKEDGKWIEEYGVKYSADGRKLISVENKSLTEYNVKEGTLVIRNEAFCGCENLSKIHLPDSLDSIGNEVFYGCSNLSQINLPDSLTSIGVSAFRKCI